MPPITPTEALIGLGLYTGIAIGVALAVTVIIFAVIRYFGPIQGIVLPSAGEARRAERLVREGLATLERGEVLDAGFGQIIASLFFALSLRAAGTIVAVAWIVSALILALSPLAKL